MGSVEREHCHKKGMISSVTHHKKSSRTRAEKNPLVSENKKIGFFTIGESLEVLGPRVQVGIKVEEVGCGVGMQEG